MLMLKKKCITIIHYKQNLRLFSRDGTRRVRSLTLIIDLFVKPTNKHQLLDPHSAHPSHRKKGISYSQAFQNDRTILQELHLLSASDKERKNVFPDIPFAGFRNGKTLKD